MDLNTSTLIWLAVVMLSSVRADSYDLYILEDTDFEVDNTETNFVNEFLNRFHAVPGGEQPAFRVFLPRRNFTPGKSMFDCHSDGIEKSRYVLCTVTPKNNSWINFCRQSGYYAKILENKPHCFIVVFVGFQSKKAAKRACPREFRHKENISFAADWMLDEKSWCRLQKAFPFAKHQTDVPFACREKFSTFVPAQIGSLRPDQKFYWGEDSGADNNESYFSRSPSNSLNFSHFRLSPPYLRHLQLAQLDVWKQHTAGGTPGPGNSIECKEDESGSVNVVEVREDSSNDFYSSYVPKMGPCGKNAIGNATLPLQQTFNGDLGEIPSPQGTLCVPVTGGNMGQPVTEKSDIKTIYVPKISDETKKVRATELERGHSSSTMSGDFQFANNNNQYGPEQNAKEDHHIIKEEEPSQSVLPISGVSSTDVKLSTSSTFYQRSITGSIVGDDDAVYAPSQRLSCPQCGGDTLVLKRLPYEREGPIKPNKCQGFPMVDAVTQTVDFESATKTTQYTASDCCAITSQPMTKPRKSFIPTPRRSLRPTAKTMPLHSRVCPQLSVFSMTCYQQPIINLINKNHKTVMQKVNHIDKQLYQLVKPARVKQRVCVQDINITSDSLKISTRPSITAKRASVEIHMNGSEKIQQFTDLPVRCPNLVIGDSILKNVNRWKIDHTGNVIIRMLPGGKIEDAISYINRQIVHRECTSLTLIVGSNNCSPKADMQEVKSLFHELVSTNQTIFPKAEIKLLSLPSRFGTKGQLFNKNIDLLNSFFEEECQRPGLTYLHCPQLSMECMYSNSNSVHLCDRGITVISGYIRDQLRQDNEARDHLRQGNGASS